MAYGTEDHHAERARARVGSVLDDKWTLDALLGVGGMAAVYAATHRNGKRAAIKILHADAALNPSVRARFLREGYVANRVGHPGAVSILDDDAAPDGTAYLVMELLEGETLDARWLRCDRSIPQGDVLAIIDQVLEVLAAAHIKKIIHRDLKPGNLFVTKDGTVKVLDFGIARLGELSGANTASATTSYHSSMGTLGFMPPEQARGRWEQVDARTDLWAVGATMYALLVGRCVHEAQTTNERLLLAMTKPAPKIATLVPDVSPPVAAIIDRALEFETIDRWENARAMQLAVREAYAVLTGRAMSLAPRLVVRESTRDVGAEDTKNERLVASAPTVLASAESISASARGRGSKRGRLAILGGVFAVLATVGVLAARQSEPASKAKGAAAASVAAATTAEPSLPSPPASTLAPAATLAPPSAPASAFASASPPAPSSAPATGPLVAAPARAPRGRPRPSSAPHAAPAPAASAPPVDLFDRRR
jgi:serine/threonine-protein kinase